MINIVVRFSEPVVDGHGLFRVWLPEVPREGEYLRMSRTSPLRKVWQVVWEPHDHAPEITGTNPTFGVTVYVTRELSLDLDNQ